MSIRLPGSKSMTARALVLAALADRPGTVRYPLRARDTELMATGLRAMGPDISTVDDAVWTVRPRELRGPADVHVGLAGTVMRFLPPVAGLAAGRVHFDGDPQARQRPMAPLLRALTDLGVRLEPGAGGGLPLTVHGTGTVRGREADLSDVSELTPVLAALATLADRPSRLRGVAHIRGHETDRVSALARELGQLGAEIVEWEDGLEIRPRPMRGGRFETYADHRMAHAAAVIGLAVPGVLLSDVACTSKTMPEFPALWADLVGGAS
jgi:3-phosphoshikimate 1-carboxyvinyltransferase